MTAPCCAARRLARRAALARPGWLRDVGHVSRPTRRRGDASPASRARPAGAVPARAHGRRAGDRRHEVRRHVRRRRRAPEARRAADRRAARGGQPRRRRPLGARQDDRRADRDGRRGLAAPDPREMDMLLSTGERISCALCAMAINDLGHAAISLTGSQAGIVTDTSHTKARILDVRARPHPRARSTRTRSCSSPASRACRTRAGRHDARPRRLGHHRGRAGRRDRRRRVRDLHRRRRRVLAPTRGSSPTRASSPSSPSRRCSRWRPPAPACCSCARSSTRATTACASTAARASTTAPVPLSCRRRRPWNTPSSPPSPTRPSEARVTLLGVPDQPGRRRADLHRAGRRQRQRRHDHPERAGVRGRAAPTCRSPCRATDLRAARATLEPIVGRARHRRRRDRRRRWARSRSSAPA